MIINRPAIASALALMATATSAALSDDAKSGVDGYAAPLEPISYELPEVKVDTRHRPILHLTGYIREISTMTSSVDTLMLYREKWVDFMIPTGKEKRYQGWTSPRLLKTKSYYKWTDMWGLDSVSDRTSHHFSWSDWVSLPRRVNFPAPISGKRVGTDTIMGRYSPTEIWRRDSTGTRVTVNVLADSTRRKWTPRLAGPLWRDTEFERLVMDYRYSDTDTFAVRPQNMDRLSCSIETRGRGHEMFRFNTKDDPYLYVATYFDLTITDREYITVGEARKKEKDPSLAIQDAMLIFESERVPRDSIISDLIARVEAIDHDSRRLGMDLDTRVGNGHMPEAPGHKTKDKLLHKAKRLFGL